MPLKKGDERYKQEHKRYAKKGYNAHMAAKRANATQNRLRSYEDSRGMSEKEYAEHLEKVKKEEKKARSIQWLKEQEVEEEDEDMDENEMEGEEQGGKVAEDEASLKV